MKLLFLDIDGVLNSYRSDIIFGDKRVIGNLDPISLALVQKVVKETKCVVCLSSNWKLHWDYKELGSRLNLPILFQTPDLRRLDGTISRADEIKEVIDGLKPEKYCILDDEEDEHEFDGMTWINVAEEEGVSYKDYLLMLQYLK